jgi:hypothetical protein
MEQQTNYPVNVGDTLTAREHLRSYLFQMEHTGKKDTSLAHRVRNVILWIDLSTTMGSKNYGDPKTLEVSNELLRQCYDDVCR